MMEQSLFGELGGAAQKAPRFEVKKWGVIPPKRKSVKRMMFDKFVKSVSSLRTCCYAASSGEASISQPNNCDSLEGEVPKMVPYGQAKNTRIFPIKDHLLAIARQSDPSTN